MSDIAREHLELRTIAVSTDAALQHAANDETRQHIRDRSHELLARLEREVLEDGADPDLIKAIERERHRLWR